MSDERDRYKTAVDRLLSLADFERKSRANQPPDWHLRRVERLMEMLDEPHLAVPIVHVAGSKGKGSTSAMIAAGLKAAGFRTGLYTSPHLHTLTERIQIGGENITRRGFADLVEELWPYVDAIENVGDLGVVSVFEMLTAMAFVHFRDNVEIAVIETGLGGRLDATNVVNPEVAVITPISRDHVKILGDKISLIAREKAGIIKAGVPTVVAKNHPVTWRVIRKRAAEVGSEVYSACATTPVSSIETRLSEDLRQEFVVKRWRQPRNGSPNLASDGLVSALHPLPDPGLRDVKVRTKLLGSHQIDNARTAATALNLLYRTGHAFDVNAAIAGISDAVWPCRTEILDLPSWPLIILDGAHNDASLKALRDTIRDYVVTRPVDDANNRDGLSPQMPYILIIGATEGHDHEAMTRELAASAFCTIATQSRHPKSTAASRITQVGLKHGLELIQQPGVDAALRYAMGLIKDHPEIELVIVTGSLFIAAEAREFFLGIEPEIYEDLKQPYMTPYEEVVPVNDRIRI